MINEKKSVQNQMEIVILENLVPQDHLLRSIDKYIDFSFIREATKDLYCLDNGRPAIDPVMLFKMLFIGYLFGIRSERQLIKEIEVNIAYRWFLGLSITEKVPNASTISQNRRRRFRDSDIAQQIFNNVVEQAIEHNMVSGKILYSDSTHIKANANKHKLVKKEVEVSTKAYMEDLEKAIDEERAIHGKKPLKKKTEVEEKKIIKVSTTDPDSGYMLRDGKPNGFHYLDHRTVDIKYNIITDVYVTAGNVNDVDPYLERLDVQIKKFNFPVKYVGLDAGFFTNPICKGIVDRKITPAVAYRLGPHAKGKFTKTKFTYDKENDYYICPNNSQLKYKTTTRQGYSEYVCKEEICNSCPKKANCLSEKMKFRTIRRHVWEKNKEVSVLFLKTEKGKGIYKKRKETIERSFADSKNLHGLRYCRFRGIKNVSEQCLFTAAVQNMKKIARKLSLYFLGAKLFNSINFAFL